MQYDIHFITAANRRKMVEAVSSQDGYIVGGRSAELRGEGGTKRTAGSSTQASEPTRASD